MTDLISRAAAVRALASSNGDYLDALDRFEKIPTVDAVPVVHARWTTERTWKHDGEWYCSACEYEPVVFMDSSYCPNCGAKMDERRDSK